MNTSKEEENINIFKKRLAGHHQTPEKTPYAVPWYRYSPKDDTFKPKSIMRHISASTIRVQRR